MTTKISTIVAGCLLAASVASPTRAQNSGVGLTGGGLGMGETSATTARSAPPTGAAAPSAASGAPVPTTRGGKGNGVGLTGSGLGMGEGSATATH